MFSATAHLYDALYAPMKDYDAEARLVADILRRIDELIVEALMVALFMIMIEERRSRSQE